MSTLPLQYYAQFHNADGSVLSASDGTTWFAVTGATSDTEQTIDITTSTSAGAGKIAFNPLSLTLAPTSILPALFADLSRGSGLSVEVAGYDGAGKGATLVSDQVYGDAFGSSATTDADGTATLGFEYGGLLDSQYDINAAGADALVDAKGWNRVTNTEDDTGASFATSAGAGPRAALNGIPTVSAAVPALTYYVQFRDSSGAIVAGDNGATWFAVSDFAISQAQTVSLRAGAGAMTGKVAFDPAMLVLQPDSVLTKLFQAQAAGTSFQQVEIAGYAGAGATATLVQDNLLKLAAVSDIASQPNGSSAVSFEYGGLLERADAPDSLGVPRPAVTAGWNRVTNQEDDTATTLAAPAVGVPATTPGAGPLTYYVQFTDATGALLTGTGGATWFAVKDVSFGSSQADTITSAGVMAGRLTYQGLSFTLDPGALLPTLFVTETAGKALGSVELAGYSGNGATALLSQDDTFKGASIHGDITDADGSAGLRLIYTSRSESTPSGALAVGSQGASGSAPLVGAPASQPAVGPLQYFVQFRAADGTLLADSSGKTWFSVNDLSFGATSSGPGSKPDAAPLSFTLAPNTTLPALFLAEAEGRAYETVEVAGYDKSAHLAQDSIFKLAAINTTATNADGAEAVTVQYGGLVERSYAATAAGPNQLTDTQGWNFVTNVSDTSTNVPGIGSGYAPTAPLNAIPVPVTPADPLQYFIRFTPYGGTALSGTEGTSKVAGSWFGVSNVSIDQVQTVNIGSQASGSGAGKIAFDDLTFTLPPSSIGAPLFQDEASGTALSQVELAGYDSSGHLVQDDLLDLAAVNSITNSAGGNQDVALAYGQLFQKSYVTDPNGTTTLSRSAGWDRVSNMVDTSSNFASSAPADALPAAAFVGGGLTYFITFTGPDGTTLKADNGTSSFAVSELSFGSTQTLNIGSQSSGAGAGKVTFDPLSFTIAPGGELAQFLSMSAKGTAFPTIAIAGFDSSGGKATLVQQFVAKLVAIQALKSNADGSTTVTAEYGGFQIFANQQSNSGVATLPAGWNRVANQADLGSANLDGSTSNAILLPANSGVPANDTTPCYCPGTAIATPAGDVPVEDLAIGDLVLTAAGRAEAIRWIGRRSFAGRFLAGQAHLLPVVVGAGALGGGLPRRDLRISPLHALFLDGVLVPAGQLVNGATIVQDGACRHVDYIHIELAQHDLILAEGAAAETFLDDDSRGMFHNASEYASLYPQAPAPAGYCAPRVESGYALEAIRQRLAGVAIAA